MSLNQQSTHSNSATNNLKNATRSRVGGRSTKKAITLGQTSKSNRVSNGNQHISHQSVPCNLTINKTSNPDTVLSNNTTKLHSNLSVVSNLTPVVSASSYGGGDLSIFSSSHYQNDIIPQNLSKIGTSDQISSSRHNISKSKPSTVSTSNLTQQFKVEQKNSTFYLMSRMAGVNTKTTTVSSSNMNQYRNEFNALSPDKRLIDDKELGDLLNELKRLTLQIELKVNGRLGEIDFSIKQELLSQVDRMYRCLKQSDYRDQYDEEETASYNSELMQIYNNLGLNQLKHLNSFHNDQPINFIKDLNNNSNPKTYIDDKFNISIGSLNSPVSINSPTTSTLSTNNPKHDDDKDDSSALNYRTNNESTTINYQTNENRSVEDDLDAQQMTFGDQFIIDNRKNMNQNRIKSSILGAVKHLSKKRQEEKTRNSFSEDNDMAMNLTINSPTNPSSSSDQQQQSKSKCVCQICGQNFTQRNSLNRHIRGHTGERPFTCDTCGKSFSDKQRLLIHYRIHSGEKPFSCSLCSRSFTQKSTVKRHLIVHFGQQSNSSLTPNPNFDNALNLKKKIKSSRKSLKLGRKRKATNQSSASKDSCEQLIKE